MRDWRELVSSRLGRTSLSLAEHEAVVAELANHLEETYEGLRTEGVSETQAAERALQELGDARRLSLKIYAAKHEEGEMNLRTRSFWVPGLVTLTASMVWLLILQSGNWPMSRPVFHASPPLAPFAIWLVTLPLIGALGSHLSRRAGGNLRARLGAAVLPSIGLAGMLVFAWVFALFVEKNPFVREHHIQFLLIFLPWTVFPGVALLAGAISVEKLTASKNSPGKTCQSAQS